MLASAAFALALLVGLLIDGALSEPALEAVGVGSLTLAMLLSASLAGTWWFLAAGIPALVLIVVSSDAAPAWAVFSAIVTAPIVFGLLALAVAVGRAAQRRWTGASRTLASATAACILLALAVGGLDAVRAPVDKRPAHSLVVDWRAGTYEGIALRARTSELIARLGPPEESGADQPLEPVGDDYYDIGGPTSFRSPAGGHETLRYDDRAFFADGGRISGWVTTSERAETPEGVGVGDSQDVVKQRYPHAECRTANEGTEYATFPLCEVRACTGRLLAFGGDPIRSVWLAAETNSGCRSCLNPMEVAAPAGG